MRTAVLCALAVALAACDPVPLPQGRCQVNAQCPIGEICLTGLETCSSGPVPLDGVCGTSSDCEDGLACTGGRCLLDIDSSTNEARPPQSPICVERSTRCAPTGLGVELCLSGSWEINELCQGCREGECPVDTAAADPMASQSTAETCAPGCAPSVVANGHCDPECNVDACERDGGDCPDSGSLSSVVGFVRIEAGVFTMGSATDELGRDRDEAAHTVTISRPFLLKATEVTQREWDTLMMANPSRFQDCGPDCPVESLTWYDAVAFCNALSLSEGLGRCYADPEGADYDESDATDEVAPALRNGLLCPGYRLPSEAEWEYAARAGTGSATYNGPVLGADCEVYPVLDQIAWYCGNAAETHPVATKRPWTYPATADRSLMS